MRRLRCHFHPRAFRTAIALPSSAVGLPVRSSLSLCCGKPAASTGEHTALIPKGRFLTVAMIGKCIDEAVLPHDSQRIVRNFLTLPQIDRILPGIAAAPLACACAPRMTATAAAFPFGDRFAIIGDAVGSRLNKDGLYSAHATASRLAETVLQEGIDQHAAEARLRPVGLGFPTLHVPAPFTTTVLYQRRSAFRSAG
jgi:hypothetical protein